jgi:hypothetical protein
MSRPLFPNPRSEQSEACEGGVLAELFRDEPPDPFAEPSVRERVAELIARAALKASGTKAG